MISYPIIFVWILYVISMFFLIFWLLNFMEKGIDREKEKLDKYPAVTITMPVLNEGDTVRQTLLSAIALDYPRNKLEIIVVNDGSTDKTREIVEKVIWQHRETRIKLINHIKNKGKGESMNEALKIAKGEFFTCLDADSFIESKALKKMLPYFKDKRVGAVLPLMRVYKPKTMLEKMQWCEYIVNLFMKNIMAKKDCVHVIPGPFSVYKTEVIRTLGGFAENNITEDLEISLRLQKNHYKIVQLLGVSVYTVVPNTLKGIYKQRNRWYKGTMINLFNYKSLVFNRKYGDFGMVQLPHVFVSGILAATMIILVGYTMIIKPFARWLYDMSYINFDLIFIFKRWFYFTISNFSMLNFNITNVFFAVTAMACSLTFLYFAYKFTKEKILKNGLLAVPAYLLLYSFIASSVWVWVFFQMLTKRRVQKW
ncbi:MAG: glycosyltransferase family 2 protein [Candidatus Nanoarchaeia archaeon]|jgi:cellulose synthase/poly-beta-1,6-N-acetylglucosamine synthase-like glycosyltransferase